MSVRLKDRNKFIPGGFVFYQPQTKWRAPRMASFTTIVQALIAHRKANPALRADKKIRVDEEGVAEEVDAFNARVCQANGWDDYIMGTGLVSLPPKFKAPSQQEKERLGVAAGRVRKIWSGVRTLNDWLDSNLPPVPQEQAEARAAVCAKCPHNNAGDFTSWFTSPASEVIRRQLERLTERQIKTSLDAQINICDICLCPLKLKVHTPFSFIKVNMVSALFDDLAKVPNCWVVAEAKAEKKA